MSARSPRDSRTGTDEVTRDPRGESFVFPPFRLDPANAQLWRSGRIVPLRPKPFAILLYLLERPHQLVSKEELLSQLWRDSHVTEAVLKTYLSEIRRALRESAKTPRFIETAHGRGYRFIGAVERSAAAAPAVAQGPPADVMPADGAHFVGREGELQRLRRAFDQSLEYRRQVVFIAGEAGIGKTLLVKRFLEPISKREDVSVGWGQCVDQYGSGEPYLPVLEALRRLSRGAKGDFVSQILRRDAPSWLAQMPGLSPAASTDRVGPALPERMLREMAEALETLTEQRSLVLWLEDLQWADPSTLDLLSYVAQRSDPCRLLVLLTYRPPVALDSQRLSQITQHLKLRNRCEELALPYLTEHAIEHYLTLRFGQHDLPAGTASELLSRTNGNALFIVTVVDSWIESGALTETHGSWRLSSPLAQLARGVPETLALMIEREIEPLTPFEREVLEAASAVGSEFSTAAVAAALDADVAAVDQLCARWCRRGQFLKAVEPMEWPDGTRTMRCEFVHALYQQVMYRLVGVTRQCQLHRRIGERLEVAHGESLAQVAAELAMHFERGQDRNRAIRYLRVAADQACDRSAFREAAGHLRHAQALLEKSPGDAAALHLELELCLALGSLLAMILGYSSLEAEGAYKRARELCHSLGETPQLSPALTGIGAFVITRGEYDTGRELCQQVLALRGQSDPEATVMAHLGLGIADLFQADLPRARQDFETVVREYRPERRAIHAARYKQDPSAVAQCYLAYTLTLLGYPDLGLRRAEESLSNVSAHADPFALGFAFRAMIFVHGFRGEHAAARQYAVRLHEICTEHGFKFLQALAIMVLGQTLAPQEALPGDPERKRAAHLLRQGLDDYIATGAGIGLTYWRSRLAEAYWKAGELERADLALRQAFEQVAANGEVCWESELHRLKGELLLSTIEASAAQNELGPDTREVEGHLLSALEIAGQRGIRAFQLRAAISLARLWRQRGDADRGRRLLAPIYAAFTEGFATSDLKEAAWLIENG